MNIKEQIKKDVYNTVKNDITLLEISVENPKDRKLADYAVPCFIMAKKLRKSPLEIANYIKDNIDQTNYDKIEVVGGYLNIFLKRDALTKEIMNKVITEKGNYGSNQKGLGKVVTIDYSSPNIAKPFGIGHLRSTAIGGAIKNLCVKNGYSVVGINHLGDWGTQFGKLIYAYKTWADKEEFKKSPIKELTELYVRFHEEALKDPLLDEAARKHFKDLEDGDEEALFLWNWFREESLKEFQKTYDLLGVNNFDSYNGEAFYNDKMDAVIKELEDKKLLSVNEGATIVTLDDMPPALIKKSDGATLYITRDLATAFYRKNTYHFDESLYVVGNEQILHFKQLKAVLAKMGYTWQENMHHISFGMMLQDGKKMSTRKGKTVKLHDVLVEAVDMASKYVVKGDLADKDNISRQIGIGAVIFNDLKNYRTNDIEFSLEDILKFEGETGPYVQYTNARIISLLENKTNIEIDYSKIEISDLIWYLVFKLYEFSDIIVKAKDEYDPSLVAKYAIDLAQDFNKFYANEKIVEEDLNKREFKLLLCEAISTVLEESLRLLGIEAPHKM